MKKITLLTLLLIPCMSYSQTIQEYYALFEHSFRKTLENSETNQVMVNEKNAFLRISNPQKPADVVSFKYFVKADQRKVFGFQYADIQEGLNLVILRTEFYVYQDKKWLEVTEEVCPLLTLKDFWGNQALPTQVSQEFNLELILPETNTTILAKSQPAVAVQFPYGNLPTGYSETFEKRKFKTIELNWNKTTGKFEVGKKY
ncbi:MAG: hypothetical protein NW226_16135 [Microscillaceae bacterium]|nr:hypothetical protein [Microscillaceae bacterium]